MLGPGHCPHLADGLANSKGALNPQITFIQSTGTICPDFTEQPATSASIESNFLLNPTGQDVPVETGVWSSVNNSGAIVYQTKNSTTSPISFAGNSNGVDLSAVPSVSWNVILTEYAPRFVVADAWGGCSSFDAYDILSGALLANQDLDVAAYAVLNLKSASCPNHASPPPPDQQITNAVTEVGALKSSLKFIAIDLEPGYYGTDQAQNLAAIVTAINTLRNTYNVKPIIYSSCNDWISATGNDTTIASSGVPIWNVRGDKFPDIFDDKNTKVSSPCQPTKGIAPWAPFGGWSGRSGKQYNDDCYIDAAGKSQCPGVAIIQGGCNPKVDPNCKCKNVPQCSDAGFLDLDVFDLSLFK